MIFILNTDYTSEEMEFIQRHNCEILSEIKLSKVSFPEMPRRMIKYGGTYIAEITETVEEPCWAVLEKFKGKYTLNSCYSNLSVLEEGV